MAVVCEYSDRYESSTLGNIHLLKLYLLLAAYDVRQRLLKFRDTILAAGSRCSLGNLTEITHV